MSIDLGLPETPPRPLAERRVSRQLMVGNVPVGGGAPVSVQSMATTLVTWPAEVLDRFLANRCGTADGSWPMTLTEPVRTVPNVEPA